MDPYTPKNSELEEFAEHMGFEGIDSDVFYEAYYNIKDEEDYDEWGYYDGGTESMSIA